MANIPKPDPVHGLGETQPLSHYEFTIHDTNTLLPKTVYVRFSVTTAGNLVIEDWNDTEVTYHFAVGNHELRSQFIKRIKAAGATAVLAPADKIQCWLQS